MFKKILVPLDGSNLAEQALTPAFELARKLESELILMRVIDIEPIFIPEMMGAPISDLAVKMEDRKTARVRYLNDIKNYLRDPTVHVRTVVGIGDAAEEIISLTDEEHVDLIFMSSHGYSGMRRWVLGSITERVLRHANCPVLVVRSDRPFDRVLVTLDGSEFAEAALEPAIAIADILGLPLTLMRVEEELSMEGMEEIRQIERLDPGFGQHILDTFYSRVPQYLETLQQRLALQEMPVDTIIARGKPADAILEVLEQEAYQNVLVAMSTHGREGISRWRYGSITEKVLRQAIRHLLVVRPEEAEE